MRALIAFFLDRPLLVNLITVGVCGAGLLLATGTTRSLIPSGGTSHVRVSASLPGASAVDVERFVTFRLEEALQGMSKARRIQSTTTNGHTEIYVVLHPGSDVAKAMEATRSRLSAVGHLLPSDMQPLRIEEVSFDDSGFMVLMAKNIDVTDTVHREAIETLLERLLRLPGVLDAKADMQERSLYIRLSSAGLERAGLSVTVARQRIIEALSHMPVGSIQSRDQEISVELATLDAMEKLEELPLIVNRAGRGITLEEVATLEYGLEDELERNLLEGSPFVTISLTPDPGADNIEVSERVRGLLAETIDQLPEPLRIRTAIDTSEVISHEIETLLSNGLGGVVIVLIILVLFLGWRVSVMTAIGLPFCYLGIVLVLNIFGVDFNIISLVAMILVIGILVDDAILVSEEFSQQLQSKDPRQAALDSVIRVGKPVLGMMATTSVAFVPLLIMQSDVSFLLKPLAIVILAAIALSIFESFFILPNHLSHFMKKARPRRDGRVIKAMRRGFRWCLGWALKFRYLFALGFGGLVALAVYILMGPMSFNPNLNLEGRTTLIVELPESAESLDALADSLAPLDDYIKELPSELLDYHATTLGRARLPTGAMVRGWKYANIALYPPGDFVEREENRYRLAEVIREDMARLEEETGFKLRLRELAEEDVRDVISIYVSGGDRLGFEEIQEKIRANLKDIDAIKSVFMDESRFQRSLRFVVDDKAVLTYGLTKLDVHHQLREHFSRQELLRHRSRGEEIKIFLGFDDEIAPTVASLEQLTVMSPRQIPVPITYLGGWVETEVLRRIEHRDMLRVFQVDVLYDRDLISADEVSDKIEERLQELRDRHPGYHISVEPSEQVAEAKSWALRLLMLCLVLIYVCLALSLGSLTQPVIVIFAIPFGFVGVVLAFYLHGMDLGIMAVVGIVGLAGVVVNDSLVMTATINGAYRRDPSAGLKKALLDGAESRMRAVLLTSLTTLGGVFPLAYGLAGEAGWLTPMVMAVGWGLLFATVLTLFFIPCFLLMMDDLKRLFGLIPRLFAWARVRLFGGPKRSSQELETRPEEQATEPFSDEPGVLSPGKKAAGDEK